ncbi:cold-shock protein [Succinivibrio dextrinosolvens]|uniref:cold-shock protein n=1 Tax=Succinivibrio dextrinosolvens TaxID=83771 RepID=UPI00241E64EB|nr:cold shock domain-containing protein [Succinivibrio dextrinosolvens]MBE6422812.1 cold shock domain-containing protein [Succinivibrio dextrinosolvens]
MKGKVKFFKEQEGYGFILGENGEEYYFNVHDIKSFEKTPRMGDLAEFNVKASTAKNKKDKAVDVEITNADTSESNSRNENRRRDDRITCPNCGRKIVPRLVTYQGSPEKSLCPYCGARIQTFFVGYFKYVTFVIFLVVFFIMFIMFGKFFR